MLLSRKHLKAGRALTGFPLREENGQLGYCLGYCGQCNEHILIRTTDAQEILAYLFRSEKQYKRLIQRLTPKLSFKKRLVKWVIGRLGEQPVMVDNFV